MFLNLAVVDCETATLRLGVASGGQGLLMRVSGLVVDGGGVLGLR